MGIVETARSYVGKVKYRLGANNVPGGWADCSTFTRYVFKKHGKDIGMNVPAQMNKGTKVSISNMQPGDLIIFKNTYVAGPSHVGIYSGNNKLIHNSSSKGVCEVSFSGYFRDHYHSARRISGVSGGGGSSSGSSGSSGKSGKKSQGEGLSKEEVAYLKRLAKKGVNKSKKATGTVVTNYNPKQSNPKLLIYHGNKIFTPVVKAGMKLEYEIAGSPGKLTFEVIKDAALKVSEGDCVTLKIGSSKVFKGYVFTINRTQDKQSVGIVAYDQIRYLKNKDTYVFKKKKASEMIKKIAKDFGIKCGGIANTKYVIKKRIEENQTLLDIIQTALDDTMKMKNKRYVLYDEYGKLRLKHIDKMRLNFIIDAGTGESYSYTSTIDDGVYNKIKIVYSDSDANEGEISKKWVKKSKKNIKKWGTLQYYESTREKKYGNLKAKAYLKLYNRKNRSLEVKNVFGHYKVRAGTSLPVMLNLGDVNVKHYLYVEKVIHNFDSAVHTMDLTLKGGKFGEL